MSAVQHADALVLFGATGDLAHRKIFPAVQALMKRGLDLPIIAIARGGMSSESFSKRVADGLTRFGDAKDSEGRRRLFANLHYVDGDYRDPATFDRLKQELGTSQRPLYYLAIPPSLFETVTLSLNTAGIAQGARVVVEKPFGRDLESATHLNRVLHSVFAESSVFRIDDMTCAPGRRIDASPDPGRARPGTRRVPRTGLEP